MLKKSRKLGSGLFGGYSKVGNAFRRRCERSSFFLGKMNGRFFCSKTLDERRKYFHIREENALKGGLVRLMWWSQNDLFWICIDSHFWHKLTLPTLKCSKKTSELLFLSLLEKMLALLTQQPWQLLSGKTTDVGILSHVNTVKIWRETETEGRKWEEKLPSLITNFSSIFKFQKIQRYPENPGWCTKLILRLLCWDLYDHDQYDDL